ncbi:hypothetical protein [Corynebacterium provencense]|uniref:hypothetical protein n=1 Tax=Corynebacterium provencense TaxID=1737425 RepID=UPI000AA5D4E5|nr:hypothetical protein [Corynebacterium provencense]
MTDDSRHSAAQSSSETPDDAVTVTAHGAVVTVASDGVHVHRTPMGRTLLPPELTVRRDQLRGWYHHAPTAASPGWIQFSLQDIPEFGVARPLRGYPATHGVSTVVAFAPGQDSEFTAVHAALTALQSGLRPEDATLALPGDAGPLPATAVGDADSPAPSRPLRSGTLTALRLPPAVARPLPGSATPAGTDHPAVRRPPVPGARTAVDVRGHGTVAGATGNGCPHRTSSRNRISPRTPTVPCSGRTSLSPVTSTRTAKARSGT